MAGRERIDVTPFDLGQVHVTRAAEDVAEDRRSASTCWPTETADAMCQYWNVRPPPQSTETQYAVSRGRFRTRRGRRACRPALRCRRRCGR